MDDPREKLLSILDIEACRVEFSNSPIVLLCGGCVPSKLYPEAPTPDIKSLRHAITLKDTSYEVFRPEEITTWQSDSIFKNLMDFEENLASICSLVVIVLESAGSIAELGAFSQLEDLSKKLIVIKSSSFNEDPSFINLGILRYITSNHTTSVKSYPWIVDTPLSIDDDIIDDAINDIQDELNCLPKSKVFKSHIGTHVIVLICELITLFVALREKEILSYLNKLDVDIDIKDLRGKLFLLDKFRLIKREDYSDSFFYMRENEEYHKLRLTPKEGESIDAIRVPIECIEYYNTSKSDRHRSQAIKNSTSGVIK